MQGEKTANQYRAIDCSLFCIILIVFESVIVKAAGAWFPAEAWTVSCVAAVTAIVMVRWGAWGAIHAVIGGLVYCLVTRGSMQHYAIYCIGNLGGLAGLLLLRKQGWKKLHGNFLYLAAYGCCTLLGMQAGRAAVSLVFGTAPAAALGFITTDTVSYIFTVVILWITSRLDGMLEDQKHYLIRINTKQEGEDR